jgi:hypothetical protein
MLCRCVEVSSTPDFMNTRLNKLQALVTEEGLLKVMKTLTPDGPSSTSVHGSRAGLKNLRVFGSDSKSTERSGLNTRWSQDCMVG